jgi:O-acetyl-ADP-ribose deacetylase
MSRNRIEVIHGDITVQKVDAIVNAANSSLLGGGGVDGAIHRAAGPRLLDECRNLGGCATGAAKITKGYSLPAKWIIHTVGPIWKGGSDGEDQLLADCYQNCLTIAKEYEIRSMAFPSISTGAYGFPVIRAVPIALRQIKQFLDHNSSPEKILLVCFDLSTYQLYLDSLQKEY